MKKCRECGNKFNEGNPNQTICESCIEKRCIALSMLTDILDPTSRGLGIEYADRHLCGYCGHDSLSEGCTLETLVIDGHEFKRDTFHFSEPEGRCHDCNAKHGLFHHKECDVERCPKCGGQLLSCGCLIEANDQTLM